MRTQLIRIGNSRGVRIPKPLIEQAGLSEEVELHVRKGQIVLSRPASARDGWARAVAELAARGEDTLLDPPTSTSFDRNEWEW
ncbi:AbrB/MazE/SpoVT family DNA-binding domain-containing protein [Candidatus Fermentibacteria bacterium]|nr:AbrB/MazE/SpoVT family DNA-binding domain-containing protein [Candidatus Fermentibacteria bacterium]